MHLWDRAMVTKPPLTNEGNHLQPKFSMRQSPASFFFWPIGHVIAWTLWVNTATHDKSSFPETIQPGYRAMSVIAHPQGLTALLTVLFQRGESGRLRRFCTYCP